MPSLREIKDRIGSVRSTLKITSAMKLVASSKLRKAQKAVETLRPYADALNGILAELTPTAVTTETGVLPADCATLGTIRGMYPLADGAGKAGVCREELPLCGMTVGVVAISSNSSLCGGFNANVINRALAVIREIEDAGAEVRVYSVGRRVADAMKKAGYPSGDYSRLVAHPSYDAAAELTHEIADKLDNVLLVYNHFVSTARQEVVVETWMSQEDGTAECPEKDDEKYIIEPGRRQVLETLAPRVVVLKFFAAILDSVAAEHAARTVAMQTATDNAQDLLSDLTLEYNKGRQQKITAEILDLLGGASK